MKYIKGEERQETTSMEVGKKKLKTYYTGVTAPNVPNH